VSRSATLTGSTRSLKSLRFQNSGAPHGSWHLLCKRPAGRHDGLRTNGSPTTHGQGTVCSTRGSCFDCCELGQRIALPAEMPEGDVSCTWWSPHDCGTIAARCTLGAHESPVGA